MLFTVIIGGKRELVRLDAGELTVDESSRPAAELVLDVELLVELGEHVGPEPGAPASLETPWAAWHALTAAGAFVELPDLDELDDGVPEGAEA